MTKTFFIGCMTSLSVFATVFPAAALSTNVPGKNEWVSMYESREETDTQVGFEILQKKFPKIFGKFDPKAVYRANITVTLYQFQGQHSCAENDLRLLIESSSYGACVKVNKDGSCFQAAAKLPALKDPCATL